MATTLTTSIVLLIIGLVIILGGGILIASIVKDFDKMMRYIYIVGGIGAVFVVTSVVTCL